jgi:hypothetical protein
MADEADVLWLLERRSGVHPVIGVTPSRASALLHERADPLRSLSLSIRQPTQNNSPPHIHSRSKNMDFGSFTEYPQAFIKVRTLQAANERLFTSKDLS